MPLREELHARLAPHGQQHVLRFWGALSPAEQQRLASQVCALDLELIARLYRDTGDGEDWAARADEIQPPEAIRLADAARDGHTRKEAAARGEAALRAGEVGVLLVAGGQGTRLGFDHPKGMYPIGPLSGHTLYRILLEKVLATRQRYDVRVPLYVMTSPATHDETAAYLETHGWFDLPAGDVRLFCQGTMPAVDAATGKLLLTARGELATSPDGHGGLVAALVRSGALEDMRRRGLRQLSYFQVDNPLVRTCDPEFLGWHLLTGSELSTQVVVKRDPLERVGNVVQIGGRARIIEYSDLPESVARRTAPDGSLLLWAGNTAIHVLDVELLARAAEDEATLPFHRAHKAVPHLDDAGWLVEPERPNALKFERFIFDLLPAARRALAVEVNAAEVFAPVKNATGRDSPSTVQAQMIALHRSWLQQAGVEVADGVAVEIGPLAALDAEELAGRVETDTCVETGTFLG
jgi:UDP-N-acetylglucosamine/UDP-N-acetylgalactosamine diphosphorylase